MTDISRENILIYEGEYTVRVKFLSTENDENSASSPSLPGARFTDSTVRQHNAGPAVEKCEILLFLIIG